MCNCKCWETVRGESQGLICRWTGLNMLALNAKPEGLEIENETTNKLQLYHLIVEVSSQSLTPAADPVQYHQWYIATN